MKSRLKNTSKEDYPADAGESKIDLLQVLREFTQASHVVKSAHFHGKSQYHYNHRVDKSNTFDLFSRASDPDIMSSLTRTPGLTEEVDADDPMEQLMNASPQLDSASDYTASTSARRDTNRRDMNISTSDSPTSDATVEVAKSKDTSASLGTTKKRWLSDVQLPTRIRDTFDLAQRILMALVTNIDLLQLSESTLRIHNFLSMYWELSYKVQLIKRVDIKVTKSMSKTYLKLQQFYDNQSIEEAQFRYYFFEIKYLYFQYLICYFIYFIFSVAFQLVRSGACFEFFVTIFTYNINFLYWNPAM